MIPRITLVIYSLRAGGAERVMSTMANYWADKGWSVTLLVFTDNKETPFYTLHSQIEFIPLGIAKKSSSFFSSIQNNIHRIHALRAAVLKSKPDIVISFMYKTNVVTLLALQSLNIPVIVSDRCNYFQGLSKGDIWKNLHKWTYFLADKIVVQTQRAIHALPPRLQKGGCVIPNPVQIPNEQSHKHLVSDPNLDEYEYCLIAVGRLEQQKGFDILLKAFAMLKDDHPKWKVTIFGEGKLSSDLILLCQQLDIEDRVYFPGREKNIYHKLQNADIFVMSSRYEGFPNALCEAMACGLPVISTDCPYGPREIIRDGIDGLLVPNENVLELASAMGKLMNDAAKRKYLAQRATEITDRFGVEQIMKNWEEVIAQFI